MGKYIWKIMKIINLILMKMTQVALTIYIEVQRFLQIICFNMKYLLLLDLDM